MINPIDLTRLLKGALKDLNCSGALCGLSINGKLSTHSAGSISKEEQNKAFYIYSISKTFTATAVLLLCETKGDFLDKPFSYFFPNTTIPPLVTVRQLLNHTGGLSDYFSKEYQQAVSSYPEKPWPYEQLMKVGLQHTPLFEAGQGWSYSNPGYGLLKELIEKISGQDYYAFIEQNILIPIGLKETRPFLEADQKLQLLAGNDPSIEGDFRERYSPGWIITGCFISTVCDVLKFYHGLFSGKLLNSASLQQMTTVIDVPVTTKPDTGTPSYGLGIMHSRNDPLGKGYGHGGCGPGYTTYAIYYPDLCSMTFSCCLVLNKSLPETPFALGDSITRAFIKYQNGEQSNANHKK